MLKRLLAIVVLVAAAAAACGPATNPNGSDGLNGLESPMNGLQTEMPAETPIS